MSPRAACRLERLGFEKVYDYVGGIRDWEAAGLPTEGTGVAAQRVAEATRRDVPTSTGDEQLGDVRRRTLDAGWDQSVVIDCDGLVVGRLRDQSWEADDTTLVADVMELGPTTVRLNALLQPLVDRMTPRDTKVVVVASPQGALIGALRYDEAVRLLSGEPPEQIWRDCEGCPGGWAVA